MDNLALLRSRPLTQSPGCVVPALIGDAGDQAARRFIEFFTANIRNRNNRKSIVPTMRD